MKTIKVLQINGGSKTFGGGSAILLNIYRHIDRTKVQFDFLTPNITTYERYRDEIEDMGGHVYELNANYKSPKGFIKYVRRLLVFLDAHEYDIIHINSSLPEFNCITAILSRWNGHCKVVVHSHNTSLRTGLRKMIAGPIKWMTESNADALFACSKSAAYAMFKKGTVDSGGVHIIKNGIDIRSYAYNEDIRNQVRKELGIENHFVIGNVARFEKAKNHTFLLEIFKEIHKLNDRALLMLVGDGSLEEQIKNMVTEMGLEKSVLFLGARDDVKRLYQAMDVFCLPSLFEGLPIVLIEAQTAGLQCYINENIAEEVDATNLINRLSLDDNPHVWANEIIKGGTGERNTDDSVMKSAGYDIRDTAKELLSIYMKLMEK